MLPPRFARRGIAPRSRLALAPALALTLALVAPPAARAQLGVKKAELVLAEGKLPAARAALEAALREHPGAPGLLVLSCECGLHQGRTRAASRRCAAARARWEALPRAHFLQAHAHLSVGNAAAALPPAPGPGPRARRRRLSPRGPRRPVVDRLLGCADAAETLRADGHR